MVDTSIFILPQRGQLMLANINHFLRVSRPLPGALESFRSRQERRIRAGSVFNPRRGPCRKNSKKQNGPGAAELRCRRQKTRCAGRSMGHLVTRNEVFFFVDYFLPGCSFSARRRAKDETAGRHRFLGRVDGLSDSIGCCTCARKASETSRALLLIDCIFPVGLS